MRGQLSTGKPYAGEPHVRFGGRGDESLSYPYNSTVMIEKEKYERSIITHFH